jgi:hypothetical protein
VIVSVDSLRFLDRAEADALLVKDQLEEIIESTRKEQEQSGNRPDDIPTNRRSSGSHT